MTSQSLAITIVTLATAFSSAHCAQLLYDGFDYSIGDAAGHAGGLGLWSGTWSASSFDQYDVQSGGFSYSDADNHSLLTVGQRIVHTGSNKGLLWRDTQDLSSYRSPGNNLYFSFLIDESGPSYSEFHVLNNMAIWFYNYSSTMTIAYGGTESTAIPFTSDQKDFYVAKYSFGSGNATVKLWRNPTLSSEFASTPLITQTIIPAGLYSWTNRVELLSRYNSSEFDEFRLGTTWSDVATVPEPSVGAMLLVTLPFILLFSRRIRTNATKTQIRGPASASIPRMGTANADAAIQLVCSVVTR